MSAELAKALELEDCEIVVRSAAGPTNAEALERVAARLAALTAPAVVEAAAKVLPPFSEAWAAKEREGYQYGGDALENVEFGYEIAAALIGSPIAAAKAQVDDDVTCECSNCWLSAHARAELPCLRRHVTEIGAGLSLRNWHSVETSYNQLRDRLDRLLIAIERAALSVSNETPGEERLREALVVIAYEQPDDPSRIAHDALKFTARALAVPTEVKEVDRG